MTTTPPDEGWEGSQPKRAERRGKPAKSDQKEEPAMRKWLDIEQNEVVTEEQLYEEFLAAKAADPENEAGHRDLSFEEYVRICLTEENGTLEPLT